MINPFSSHASHPTVKTPGHINFCCSCLRVDCVGAWCALLRLLLLSSLMLTPEVVLVLVFYHVYRYSCHKHILIPPIYQNSYESWIEPVTTQGQFERRRKQAKNLGACSICVVFSQKGQWSLSIIENSYHKRYHGKIQANIGGCCTEWRQCSFFAISIAESCVALMQNLKSPDKRKYCISCEVQHCLTER